MIKCDKVMSIETDTDSERIYNVARAYNYLSLPMSVVDVIVGRPNL